MRKKTSKAHHRTHEVENRSQPPRQAARRMARYLLVRLATILLTIFFGAFVTILVVNQAGTIDSIVQMDIDEFVQYRLGSGIWADLSPEQIEAERTALEVSAGLHLPWLRRQARWTWNAMTFQWGEALAKGSENVISYLRMSALGGPYNTRFRVTNIITTHLPNTLLLVGAADLFVFLAGIPLALHLGRRVGGWVDRLVSLLAPLASIPSWVHGILLVLVFSVWLGWLPYGKMYDMLPPETTWGYITVVSRHMVLPVLAILLTLFLQCVTAWRTFFFLYSNEDYVELAVAKGAPARLVERRHILRPTLPYILTSFALTLIGFWQMTTALEYFFSWPGIGMLYVQALYTWDILVAIGIVVIFAYLLGLVIFLLDLAYALVDPRIRLGEEAPRLREPSRGWRLRGWKKERHAPLPILASLEPLRKPERGFGEWVRQAWKDFVRVLVGFGSFLRRLLRLPSGAIGLVILAILVVLSGYALIRFPSARMFNLPPKEANLDPYVYLSIPHNALPVWTNWLREPDLPPTLSFDTQDGTAQKSVEGDQVTITFTFDYPYADFPQNLLLVFDAPYEEKASFASMLWTLPNGEEVALKQSALTSSKPYDFSVGIPRQTLSAHGLFPLLQSSSGAVAGQGGYPAFYVLFGPAEATEAVNLRGTYSLRIEAFTFEPKADVDARLILVGRVYGSAGTDNLGGDLLIPLAWGAPAALAIGLAGAFLTTLVSMVIAAASAWQGGWVDGLVQRLSEASMVIPFLAVGIMLWLLFRIPLWTILMIVVLLNALGSPVKAYRAAFLQVREAPYIEAARAYGAGNGRIILRYMIPRIARVLVPQLAFLVPSYIFLEATLAIFGVRASYPTWGG